MDDEKLYVIESSDGDDEWTLDFNVPHHYLEGNAADEFDQVFGFIFNGREDAIRFLEGLRRDFSNLRFRLREATITTVNPTP